MGNVEKGLSAIIALVILVVLAPTMTSVFNSLQTSNSTNVAPEVYGQVELFIPFIVGAGVVITIVSFFFTGGTEPKFTYCRFRWKFCCPEFRDAKESICLDEAECETCIHHVHYKELEEEEYRRRDEEDARAEEEVELIRCRYCGVLVRSDEFKNGRCPNCSAPRR